MRAVCRSRCPPLLKLTQMPSSCAPACDERAHRRRCRPHPTPPTREQGSVAQPESPLLRQAHRRRSTAPSSSARVGTHLGRPCPAARVLKTTTSDLKALIGARSCGASDAALERRRARVPGLEHIACLPQRRRTTRPPVTSFVAHTASRAARPSAARAIVSGTSDASAASAAAALIACGRFARLQPPSRMSQAAPPAVSTGPRTRPLHRTRPHPPPAPPPPPSSRAAARTFVHAASRAARPSAVRALVRTGLEGVRYKRCLCAPRATHRRPHALSASPPSFPRCRTSCTRRAPRSPRARPLPRPWTTARDLAVPTHRPRRCARPTRALAPIERRNASALRCADSESGAGARRADPSPQLEQTSATRRRRFLSNPTPRSFPFPLPHHALPSPAAPSPPLPPHAAPSPHLAPSRPALPALSSPLPRSRLGADSDSALSTWRPCRSRARCRRTAQRAPSPMRETSARGA
ncbi:hypothetical protein B0H15DRAFT_980994 [Mycena belliarum]|uniref:Uncharacterized protein n=1 Tax=Mycena belliarum TaxID=1033014 RepID=A0AAD6XH82_9AGAR|nr:hypothetical protein B0H15DRAFT_980994 [Mycena belliae]